MKFRSIRRVNFAVPLVILSAVVSALVQSCGNNNSPTSSAPVTVYVYYTATPTYTPTICYNASQTPCTPTFTSTYTNTFTPTNTYTPTNTLTFTLTFTKTFTPTPTSTPTNSPTNTLTNTPCNYPGNTCTNTPTPPFTNTFTPSPTYSPSLTPTPTVGSPTPTPTPFHPWFDTPVTVGGHPLGIAIMPNGAKAYVALNTASGKVVSIDLSSYSVAATINVNNYPGYIAITSDSALAVACNGAGTNDGFSIINTSNNTVSYAYGNCSGNTLYGIATIPAYHKALVGDSDPSCIYTVIDYLDLDTQLVTTYVGGVSMTYPYSGGFGMAMSPDGSTAISTNSTGYNMANIGVAGGRDTSINMNQYTYAAAILPNNTEMLVVAYYGLLRLPVTGGSSVTVVSTGWNSYNQCIAVTPDSKWAVFCTSTSVEVEDLTANAPLTTFSRVCENVAITPDGKTALMTQYGGTVQVLHIEP